MASMAATLWVVGARLIFSNSEKYEALVRFSGENAMKFTEPVE